MLTIPSGITEAFKADKFDKKINLGASYASPPAVSISKTLLDPTSSRIQS
jgi:hypothetical protein